MFKKTIYTFICLFSLSFSLKSQEPSNKTEGLELPPNQIISSDEGFVSIQAKCKGAVKWLVNSSEKVKQLINPTTNSIIVSVPSQGGIITVYAVGLTEDKKLTDFVSCNIIVKASNLDVDPRQSQRESTKPQQSNREVSKQQDPLHVTFVLDFNSAPQDVAQLLNSPSLKKLVSEQGCYFRVLDLKSSVVSNRKLDVLYNKVGGPALIIQKSDGTLATPVMPIPKSEKGVLDVITKLKN